MKNKLNNLFPNRVLNPHSINEIPQKGYMVYILTFNEMPIVLGHGRRNRAKVIFDNTNLITTNHLKAIFVRLYNLFGNGSFSRYIITCKSKENAKEVEKYLHNTIGGDNRNVPIEIRKQLFENIQENSTTYLILEIALRSSFDGLSDIRKWRKDGLIDDIVWGEISNKLKLNQQNNGK
ncbi:MAG: hypothetical protein WAQ28_18430 [Bacteroidia bacterium]|jgi:hypothetical protein